MPASDGPLPIEDYAMIGDCNTTALVGRNGSIDWLCWPRFDGGACFAALLGSPDNGRWQIAPAEAGYKVHRAYRDGGLVLETVFTTGSGTGGADRFHDDPRRPFDHRPHRRGPQRERGIRHGCGLSASTTAPPFRG